MLIFCDIGVQKCFVGKNNRSVMKILGNLRHNMGQSVDCLRFRYLHVFQNMRACEDKWMQALSVHFSKENTAHTAGGTGQQRMLTYPSHLILRLIFVKVPVCSAPVLCFFFALLL